MIAERKDTGEVVGAALTLPDFNQVLAKVKDGRLLPFGWLVALRNRKKIDRYGSSPWASSPSTSTPAWRRGCTSCISRRAEPRRRPAARWAGSSRRTRR